MFSHCENFSFAEKNMKRRLLPYRSGINAHVPITPELILVWAIIRQMRLQIELFYPREKTRWN